jgi:hypothetical protein
MVLNKNVATNTAETKTLDQGDTDTDSSNNWNMLKDMPTVYKTIEERGLTHHLQDLEVKGITVIPPEKIGDDSILHRAREAILRISEERTGVKHDIDNGDHGNLNEQGCNNTQNVLYGFFEEDPVFEEIVQHPMTLPLIEYFLGTHCNLSSLTSFVKWKDQVGYGENLGMHDDSVLYQGPVLPAIGLHKFNTNWILTDYTKDNGALCVVPGSHKLCRHPKPGEGVEDAVEIEAPAGSVLAFHGNLWHGAFPKKTEGLRISVNCDYCGRHYRLQENFQGRLSMEVLERNDSRFQELMGYNDHMGWKDLHGPVPWSLRESWGSLTDSEKKDLVDEMKRKGHY